MRTRLTELIDRFSDVKILVLGDFLLDQFVFGEISRVSREAPVLILKYQDTYSVPGGGANTVANAHALGAHVLPLGFIGDDEFADQLFHSWPEDLDKRYVFRESRFQTTRKIRILAGSFHSFRQQVVRMDYETSYELQHEHESKLLKSLTELVPQVDAVILSDYSLGNLNPRVRNAAIATAADHGKIMVADSRDHPEVYKGVTSMTPNITEIEKALSIHFGGNDELLETVGSRLLKEWRLKALLITRGKLGMSLFETNGVTHIPIHGTDEVADVTGAGDTVIAAYTATLAARGSFKAAARLANYAAGIVVMKKGTATTTRAELIRALREDLSDL